VVVYFSLFYFVGVYFSLGFSVRLDMFQCFLCIIFEDVLFEVILKFVTFFQDEFLC